MSVYVVGESVANFWNQPLAEHPPFINLKAFGIIIYPMTFSA